jgi:RimJ/RimL family protein N-acetyltransferase
MAAAAATVAHAIDTLGARTVRAVVRPENAASRRLLERLAFHIGARARLRGRPDDPLLVYFAPPRQRTP